MLTNTFVAVMLAGLAACAITSAGILVISRHERWAQKNSVYFMSFAAGILAVVSLVHVTPRSFEMSRLAPWLLLAGFFALHVSNRFLHRRLHHQAEDWRYAQGLIFMLGIGFHSFVDGIIYSVTFEVGVFTGLMTVIGTVLHEFPEGIIAYILLQEAGYPQRKRILYAFLAAGLTTPLGALVSYPFIAGIGDRALGILLALSAGALVYVWAGHLIPAIEEQDRRYATVALLGGLLLGMGIILSKENPF
jgi:zinc transporter ZupT